jgi:hypothetical protein
MENFRSRPKGNYIQKSRWQELYALSEHWKSDLLFYKDDLKFLRHLVDKYFIWLKGQDNLEGIRSVGEEILTRTRECDDLLDLVNKQLSHPPMGMEEPLKYDSKEFRTKHAELEDDIAQFIKNARENRIQLFKITEYVMDSENLEERLKG